MSVSDPLRMYSSVFFVNSDRTPKYMFIFSILILYVRYFDRKSVTKRFSKIKNAMISKGKEYR